MNDFYNLDYINIDGNHIHKTAIIGENVRLGTGNVILPYAVIGELGCIRDKDKSEGSVIIGDNNEIGSHVCIMAGTEGVTKIGDRNKIMNYVNIGHNVELGNDCEVGVHSIIAGHTRVADNVKIKIGCNLRNRLKIGENSLIGMGSNVTRSVQRNKTVKGNPAK